MDELEAQARGSSTKQRIESEGKARAARVLATLEQKRLRTIAAVCLRMQDRRKEEAQGSADLRWDT